MVRHTKHWYGPDLFLRELVIQQGLASEFDSGATVKVKVNCGEKP